MTASAGSRRSPCVLRTTALSQTSLNKRPQKGMDDQRVSVIAINPPNEWDWIICDGEFGLFDRTHT